MKSIIPQSLKEIRNLVPCLTFQIFNQFEFSLVILSKNLFDSIYFLKNNIGFQYKLLSCISGVDLLKKSYRFIVSYELLSLTFNSRIRIKVFTEDYAFIPSIISIYRNANWWEREIWDLYGIYFENHPDLRRILTDYGFEGYPLRKDFPLFGFRELRYDQTQRIIVSESVHLSQEYRFFNYETPW